MDLYNIFYINCDRTIEYFKFLLKHNSIKSILFILDHKIQYNSSVSKVPGSIPTREFIIKDPVAEKVQTSFFGVPIT